MSRPTEASYDEYPYPGAAFWFTHPDHLAVFAEIHGMQPAAPRTARVLELGCGDGNNLCSIAAALPEAELVGLDLSASQVALATELARRASLGNVRFVQADVRDVGPDFGRFDYIISHGVYSWIPSFARDGLLAAIGHTLAPHGVAMVSYNAYPGWHDVAPIRRFLKYHTDPIKSVEGRVRQARSMTDVYCRALLELDAEAREAMAEKLHQNVAGMSDWLLRHDWLADNHFPTYFVDFIDHARRYGLDYLANATPASQNPDALEPGARAMLMAVPDRVRRQQYLDFFQHTRFRTTLLRRAETPVSDTTEPERYFDYGVEARIDLSALDVNPPPLHPGLEPSTPDEVAAAAKADAERAKYQVVIGAIARHAPAAPTVREVFAEIVEELVKRGLDDGYGATEEGRAEMLRALGGEIGWMHMRELVHLWKQPPTLAPRLPGDDDRPRTGALQRVLAETRDNVSSLGHRYAYVPGAEQRLLTLLDGTRTVRELEAIVGPETRAALAALFEKGFLSA